MDIPPEKQFHFRDGTSVANLEELQRKLEGISYQEFYRHVNADKNDFANWIRHVLREEDLASDLEKVSSIVETVEIIHDFVQPPVLADDVQSKIEEQLGVHVPIEDVPTTQPSIEHSDEPADLEIIDEHLEEITRDGDAANDGTEEESEGSSINFHSGAHKLSDHDYSRLIVKDFMYGLFFGLVIGLILGRILSL